MRWFVEISSLGKDPPPSTLVCVEAPQWQPALQKARSLRGDDGALSNFSIELLDDGYRAIDPAARLKYVVRKAPDDAVLTNGNPSGRPVGRSEPPKAISKAPAASVKPATSEKLNSAAHAAPTKPAAPRPGSAGGPKSPSAPVKPVAAQPTPIAGTLGASARGPEEPAHKGRPGSQTRVYASTGAAAIAEPSSGSVSPASADKSAVEVPNEVPSRGFESVTRKRAEGTVGYGSPGAAALRDGARAPRVSLVPYVLLNNRHEQPSARSPLTYREQAYSVAEGTSMDEAEALVRDRLRQITAEIEKAPKGKLVNLAVFDHSFKGRPKRPPLVTLTWKDWKNVEPEVRFPMRDGPGNTPTPLAPSASGPPPAPSAPSAAVSAPVVVPPAPPSPPGAPAPVAAAPAPAIAAPPRAPQPVSAPMSTPFKSVADSVRFPPEPEPLPLVRRSDKPPVVAEEPVPLVRRSDAPPAAPQPEPVVAQAMDPLPPPAPIPRERPASGSSAVAEPLAERRPAGSITRLAGDELLAELFEAFADLHFLVDTLSGADFVLGLTLDKLPSEVAVLSMFDINRREFVIVRQVGASRSAVLARISERAPIVQAAMRSQRALVIEDATTNEHANDERWQTMGVELRSMVCAPIELGGRYLGLLELANPLDGGRFTDGDGHALTYIGQQFAEFVAQHGVVTDAELIGKQGHRQ